jgi:hypothetical protein
MIKKRDTNTSHSLRKTRYLRKLDIFEMLNNLRLIVFFNLLQKYFSLWYSREFDGASFEKRTS